MQIYIHQTHHTIADFTGICEYLKQTINKINEGEYNEGLHLFPELFLTGYPLQDLCIQKNFISNYLKLKSDIDALGKEITNNSVLLMGGLDYSFDEEGLPLTIENVIFELKKDSPLTNLYAKRLLPNYDIFDEEKYFHPGSEVTLWQYQGKTIPLMICEDMWYSSHHDIDPVDEIDKELNKLGKKADLVINLSASPFNIGKENSRVQNAASISTRFNCPFVYVNRVGAEDEVIFDGSSFVLNGQTLSHRGQLFISEVLSVELNLEEEQNKSETKESKRKNTWESLFTPSLEFKDSSLPTLKDLSDRDCETILHAMKLSVQDYAKKAGMKNFLVALSGGIDSALVLAILKLIKEPSQKLEAVYMPGFFSATLSYDLSKQMCEKLDISFYNLPIKFLHSNVKNSFGETFGEELSGLADENIQSRLRGALLYARSNQTGAMVLNTSNKSEIAVGYSTQYGDSVGALSLLGDLYKTEVFRLARYINDTYGEIIPEGIITRPPSAELREDQEDSQSLPPYERLDAILEGILSYQYDLDQLLSFGFSAEEVKKVYRLYNISEYKRYQFCPIIKLKAKSFGFGYRVPICKTF